MVTFLGKFAQAEGVVYSLISVGVIGGVLAGAILLRRRHPQLLFGFLLYLVCLIPVLNFFRTDPIVAARYSYLPCLGLFFAFTAVPFSGKMKFVAAVSLAFTVAWSFSTAYQLKYYENNVAYWENTVPYVNTAYAYTHLGYAYYDDKQYEKALEALYTVQPAPPDPRYYRTVGNSCFELGDYECAAGSFNTALLLDPRDGFLSLDLARTYLAMKDHSAAAKCLDRIMLNFPHLRQDVERIRQAGLR
jgi:tetratricopeptide (TPR) repeat protein